MALPSNENIQLPLSEQTYYILLSLFQGPRHGYAILKDIQQLSEGRLLISVSTLYTSLKRLVQQGWIVRVGVEEPGESGRPRKQYQLTHLGQSILIGEAKRLQSLVQSAQLRLPKEAL